MCKEHARTSTPKRCKTTGESLDNPRYAFVKIMNQMYNKKNTAGISARSVISETAKIGSGCYIGDYTVIGDDCIIGDNTMIGTRVSLQNCHSGNNSIIQSGVTIGEDGFAFVRNADGELERFPHIRGVKIGDNVEVGANTNIARGSLSDTTIGNGTKIADMASWPRSAGRARDLPIARRAAEHRLWVMPLSTCYFRDRRGELAGAVRRQGLVLGFGGTAADDSPEAVRRLRRVIEG